MIHIQKSNEGIDIPKKDFASINISTNLYFNGREIKRYVNKVYMKIKPSNNALCEDERIAREDCIQLCPQHTGCCAQPACPLGGRGSGHAPQPAGF